LGQKETKIFLQKGLDRQINDWPASARLCAHQSEASCSGDCTVGDLRLFSAHHEFKPPHA
jgi:hypothetical protein